MLLALACFQSPSASLLLLGAVSLCLASVPYFISGVAKQNRIYVYIYYFFNYDFISVCLLSINGPYHCCKGIAALLLLRKGMFALQILVLFGKIHPTMQQLYFWAGVTFLTVGSVPLLSAVVLYRCIWLQFLCELDGNLRLQPQTRSGTNNLIFLRTAVWLCQKNNLVISPDLG